MDDTGEGMVWERISAPLLSQQVSGPQSADDEETAAAVEPQSGALPSDDPSPDSAELSSAASAAAISITRFQCVGRLRVLVALPVVQSSPVAATNHSGTAAGLADLSESAACHMLSSPPSCKIVTACWSLTDRCVLTSSGDHCLRLWPTPPAGKADELFAAECRLARRRRRRAGATDPLVLPTSKRSFIAIVPLLRPSATFRLHSAEVAVLRPHPRLTSVVLTAGHDGRVAVWDVEDKRLLRSFVCNVEAKLGESVPAVAHFVDGSWSPSGDLCALSDEEGKVWLFGVGSRIPYQLAPTEQFYQSDYAPITLDHDGWVIDSNTQLPPHLMPDRTATMIRASGQPYDPQPRSGTIPDKRIPITATNTADEEQPATNHRTVTDAHSLHARLARPLSPTSHQSASQAGLSPLPPPTSTTASCDPAAAPVRAATVLQADIVQASLSASIRMERRQRWQQSVLTSNSMATHAARQRRDNERHDEADGGDGLWNEHFDECGHEQLHIAADVELDLADIDETLDATEERRTWNYDVALTAPPTPHNASGAWQQPQRFSAAAPLASTTVTAGTASSVDEAYSDWKRAQRMVEAELLAADDEHQPDEVGRASRAANTTGQPQRSSSRIHQQQPHQQPYQLRARESPLATAALTDAATLAAMDEASLLSAEQAALDAVVARDIRAVQRAERRAALHPDDARSTYAGSDDGAEAGEVGEDTPLQTRIRAVNGRSARNRLTHTSRRRAAARRVEYKEDDWDIPMEDDNSDSSLSRDGGEWREEDDYTYSDGEEEGAAEDGRAQYELHSASGVGGSRGRRRRTTSRRRRAPQRREQRELHPAVDSEALPQHPQPVRISHRLAERAQHVHILAASAERTDYSNPAHPASNSYHSSGRRIKRRRYSASSHSLDDYKDDVAGSSAAGTPMDRSHDAVTSADTYTDSGPPSSVSGRVSLGRWTCRHQRGDEYAILSNEAGEPRAQHSPTAAADDEHEQEQTEQYEQERQQAGLADRWTLRIKLRRLARLESESAEDNVGRAEGDEVGDRERAAEEQLGLEAAAGLRRGRSRMSLALPTAAAVSVPVTHAMGGSRRVRIVFGGQQVGTLDMNSVSADVPLSGADIPV